MFCKRGDILYFSGFDERADNTHFKEASLSWFIDDGLDIGFQPFFALVFLSVLRKYFSIEIASECVKIVLLITCIGAFTVGVNIGTDGFNLPVFVFNEFQVFHSVIHLFLAAAGDQNIHTVFQHIGSGKHFQNFRMLDGDFVDAVDDKQKLLFIDVVITPIEQRCEILWCAVLTHRGNLLITAVKKLIFFVSQQAVSYTKEEISLAANSYAAAKIGTGKGTMYFIVPV